MNASARLFFMGALAAFAASLAFGSDIDYGNLIGALLLVLALIAIFLGATKLRGR